MLMELMMVNSIREAAVTNADPRDEEACDMAKCSHVVVRYVGVEVEGCRLDATLNSSQHLS